MWLPGEFLIALDTRESASIASIITVLVAIKLTAGGGLPSQISAHSVIHAPYLVLIQQIGYVSTEQSERMNAAGYRTITRNWKLVAASSP